LTALANTNDETINVRTHFGSPKRVVALPDRFVLMSFQPELRPVYEDHITKVATQLRLSVKRADDFFTAHAVMQDIWAAICGAQILLADCTGRNPNVFYEIGLAHVVGKPVVLITQNAEDVPFDLKAIRYIQYEYTPRGMSLFETKLSKTILEILVPAFPAPQNQEG
jgi:hypothetical protein